MRKAVLEQKAFFITGFGMLFLGFILATSFGGLTSAVFSLVGLAGSGMIGLGLLLASSHRGPKVRRCRNCGALPPSADDRYCRKCGVLLA